MINIYDEVFYFLEEWDDGPTSMGIEWDDDDDNDYEDEDDDDRDELYDALCDLLIEDVCNEDDEDDYRSRHRDDDEDDDDRDDEDYNTSAYSNSSYYNSYDIDNDDTEYEDEDDSEYDYIEDSNKHSYGKVWYTYRHELFNNENNTDKPLYNDNRKYEDSYSTSENRTETSNDVEKEIITEKLIGVVSEIMPKVRSEIFKE